MKKHLCRIIGELVGRPYKLGEVDCFSTIIDYLLAIEVEVPMEFEGHAMDEYKDLYLTDPEEAKALMVRYLDSFLPTVPVKHALPGDILLVSSENSVPFLAVKGGGGALVTASELHGFRTYSSKYFIKHRGWQCRQQSQS